MVFLPTLAALLLLGLPLRERRFLRLQNCLESAAGLQFFSEHFRRFDKNGDGRVNQAQIEDMFATSPGVPWGKPFLTKVR